MSLSYCTLDVGMYACIYLHIYLRIYVSVQIQSAASPLFHLVQIRADALFSHATCRKTIPSVHRTPSLRRYLLTQTAQQFPSFLHDTRSSPLLSVSPLSFPPSPFPLFFPNATPDSFAVTSTRSRDTINGPPAILSAWSVRGLDAA